MKPRRALAVKRLYGPTIQYADGTVVVGEPLDVEYILSAFERSDAEARSAFLCAFAHDLTVALRALLFDRPVSEADLDRVQDINECLHQLTSCVNPRKRWPAHDEALLIRAIIEDSFAHGLDKWIGHALATAAGSAISARKPVAAK
jgi:hypothetical protein